ncbi:hypothetical protein AACH06_21835 [Ideonella sp. DXS29W]|uniref:DUF1579 domain-containing protein n=1 Tax=Ideonella lacteola TaxID=2984193 RepID=A0ABU9BXZ8_9BURK
MDDRVGDEIQRRTMLQMALGVAAGGGALAGAAAMAATAGMRAAPAATGKPGDFEFLAGEWRIQHQRLKDGQWDRFEGEATVHSILGGVGSVEELRIPARQFSGMGLRLLDVERKLWADHWVNARSGVLTPPPSWGSFVDGVGIWDSVDEEAAGGPVIWRGVWDRITDDACRWYQASSSDAGRTWTETWIMAWTRA